MEQPKLPNASGGGGGGNTNVNRSQVSRKKIPTPEELVAHYEAQGLDNKEASLRVIQELRSMLYQTAASGNKKKDRFMTDTVRKLDNINTRLAVVETKLDGKPGYPGAMAIGTIAGSAVTALFGGFGQIWRAVKSATSANHSPSS